MSAPPTSTSRAGPDPVVLVRSRFWAFHAIGVAGDGEACVVDPGIYPDEIEALSREVRSRGGADRAVTHVVLTHSHHDHIRGWMRFPGARVVLPSAAAAKGEGPRQRILAAKLRIDERLSISDPGFRYPVADVTFEDRATLDVGGVPVELRFLPGHSDCTSVVWLPSVATLCTADYLVSPGLPYCRWRAAEFEAALETLRGWVVGEGVERVIPSHHDVLLGRDAILRALDAERDYFLALREAVRGGLAAGLDGETCIREAARAMAARRGRSLGPRERQDADNARRVLAEERAG